MPSLRPLCFMVMPYGRKPTQAGFDGGPSRSTSTRCGTAPTCPSSRRWLRAGARHQDTGAPIITQMLERLYFAGPGLADMTIPNGNVYYEIGTSATPPGPTVACCWALDWSRQLFDVAQMRTVRYPLPEARSPRRRLAYPRRHRPGHPGVG